MSNSFKTAACTALRSLAVLVLGVSAFAVSCVREGADNPDRPVRAGEIRIEYSVDGVENATRSVTATAAERLLKDVHVMFFNIDGTFIACQKADVTNGSSFFSFPVPEGVVEGVEYKTLIVGNALSWLPSGSTTFEEYLNTMSDRGYKTIHDNLAALTSGRIDVGKGLPMWGEVYSSFGGVSGFVLYKNNTGAYYFNGHIIFYRAVCRLDLTNKVPDKLVITKVKVCNYREGGHYFLQNVPFGNIQSAVDSEDGWIPVDVPLGSVQSVTAKVYTFPNTVSVVSQNDDQTTYLMIAGKYNGSATETYYRFNMVTNSNRQLLQHNHCYTGIISNVAGPGSNSPGEAKDANPMFDYTVSDWSGGDSGGDSGEITIYPKPPVEGYVINSLNTHNIYINALTNNKKITVWLPSEEYEYSVSSSFSPTRELFLTKDVPLDTTNIAAVTHLPWANQFYLYGAGGVYRRYYPNAELHALSSGSSFYLNVFQSAPVMDITGNITITVSSLKSNEKSEIKIPITLKSNVSLGDPIFYTEEYGYIMVSDRNVGVTSRSEKKEDYYSFYNTGFTVIADSLTTEWGGSRLQRNKDDLKKQCQDWISKLQSSDKGYSEEDSSKWRPLYKEEMEVLKNYLYIGYNRPYVISPYRNLNGESVGCYFPTGTSLGYQNSDCIAMYVGLASSTQSDWAFFGGFDMRSLISSSNNYYINKTAVSYFQSGIPSNAFFRLRCVREISVDEISSYIQLD